MSRDIPQPLHAGGFQFDRRVQSSGDGAGDERGTLVGQQFQETFFFLDERVDAARLPVEKIRDCLLLGERWNRNVQIFNPIYRKSRLCS